MTFRRFRSPAPVCMKIVKGGYRIALSMSDIKKLKFCIRSVVLGLSDTANKLQKVLSK